MGDPKGFLVHSRQVPGRRPVPVRLRDWREVYEPFPEESLRAQASRCMDCGIPFCHEGCPLGNLIPEWNHLVYEGRYAEASQRLEGTNNFPEFTGRLCPAPCEGSCVLGINSDPVTIKQVELEIAEWGAADLRPGMPVVRTRKRVAVVGSGPAGLAAAQQLTRAGHDVTVYERAEKIGGLLRYGIPEFKLEKSVLDRRLAQMREEGTRFLSGVSVGVSSAGTGAVPEVAGAAAPGASQVPALELASSFDALILAGGSTRPRDLPVPGRELEGVHFAMEYLKAANLACEGSLPDSRVTAAGKHVVIIGGGDTGADCLGTAHRQGAASVVQLEIMAAPPAVRAPDNPWPLWPLVMRTSSAHEEGGERLFGVTTIELVRDRRPAAGEGAGGPARVGALRLQQVSQQMIDGQLRFVPVPGTESEIEAELVLLALGFVGSERQGVVAELGLEVDGRGNVAVSPSFETSRAGVFACGDMARGQSLVVWAIAEGRSAAANVDRSLMGTTSLPEPIVPGQVAMR